jgi:hypothetical protein
MPIILTYIIKPVPDHDLYSLWTPVESKVIFRGTRAEMRDYILSAPTEAIDDVDLRLHRADTTGTSDPAGVVGSYTSPLPGV